MTALSTQTQRQIVLEALKAGPQTTEDLRQKLVYQPAARVFELKKQGWPITTTTLEHCYDEKGIKRPRMAEYRLQNEKGGNE